MVNLNVQYRRAGISLRRLMAEIRAWRPGALQNKGFITGYKSAGNYSGHNADSKGITHAVDIGVDIENDGTGLDPADAARLVEHLRKNCHRWIQYIIYNGRICGNHTNWQWAFYAGASPHTDHIHISECDLYYGDPSPIPASVYDAKHSWGIRNIDRLNRRRYIIKPGDTLASIANRYNSTIARIKAGNKIRNANLIYPGQTLYL